MKTQFEYKSTFRILSHGRVGLFVSGVLASLILSNTAYALPQGGQLKDGQATISLPNSTQMNINQASNRAVIDWQSFNIAANEKLNIIQPSSSAMLLSRVVGNDPSKIFGQITANGGLMLINQNGILFGKGSRVDVAALVASTANIKNEDFMAGKMRFMTPSNPNAKIINEGTITVKEGGLAALVAPYVQNNGFIIAKYGTVAIAGANTATIDLYGDNLIVFETPDELKKSIENSGTIEAGYVAMSVSDAKKVVDSSINMNGIIKAQNMDTSGGKVILTGGNIKVSGTVDASGAQGDGGNVKIIADMKSGTLDFSGKVDVSSKEANGGFVETSGNSVKIADTASVNAKGKKYGEWLIDPNDYTIAATGGDITGATLSNALENASVTISTATQGHSGNGDIFVYDNITWNANTVLTLNAERDIHINSDIMAHGATAGIALNYGAGRNYYLYDGAKITLDNVSGGANQSVVIGGQNYTVLRNTDAIQNITTTGLNGKYVMLTDMTVGGGGSFTPIGPDSDFTGTFDGFGHTLSNVVIDNSANNTTTGLFSIAGSGSIIKNITLQNPTVTGNNTALKSTGALVGYAKAGSLIRNAFVVGGSVTSSGDYVGGLVGSNYGIIRDSGSSATVQGHDYVGGLAGVSRDAELSNVYAEGDVTGHDTVGGLVGGLWAAPGGSSILGRAYATGNVNGNYLVGGLVGETSTYSTITNAYADGDVSGGYKVGGLIGESSGTVTYAYATGDVYASEGAVGGLIGGIMEGSVSKSFAVGNVSTAGNNPVSVSDGMGGTVTIYPVDAGGFVGTMENGSISESWSSGNIEITKINGLYGGGFVGRMQAGSITDSMSHGNITTHGDYVGGFVGEAISGTISRVFATGAVTTTGSHIGGVYGYIHYAPSSSMYYNQDTIGSMVGYNDGGISKTTAQLKSAATFAGWNIDPTGNDPTKIWIVYDPTEYIGLTNTGYSKVDGYTTPIAPTKTSPSSNTVFDGSGSGGSDTANGGGGRGGNNTDIAHSDVGDIDTRTQEEIDRDLANQTRQNLFVEIFNEIKTPVIENKLQDRVTARENSYNAMVNLLSKPAITSKQAADVLPYLQLMSSTIPSNYKQLADVSEKTTGLDANVFYDKNAKKIVIAFAGTEDATDIKANMGIEFNEASIARAQFEKALQLFNLIKDKPQVKELLVNGGTIEVAGYSIGGAIAEYIGAATGVKAYAFNPSAVPDGVYESAGLAKNASNVLIVRSALDTVSATSTAYGSEHLSQNVVNVPGLNTLGSQHSIDDLVVGLKNASGKSDTELKNELASLQDKVKDKDSETSKIVTAKLEDSLNKPVYGDAVKIIQQHYVLKNQLKDLKPSSRTDSLMAASIVINKRAGININEMSSNLQKIYATSSLHQEESLTKFVENKVGKVESSIDLPDDGLKKYFATKITAMQEISEIKKVIKDVNTGINSVDGLVSDKSDKIISDIQTKIEIRLQNDIKEFVGDMRSEQYSFSKIASDNTFAILDAGSAAIDIAKVAAPAGKLKVLSKIISTKTVAYAKDLGDAKTLLETMKVSVDAMPLLTKAVQGGLTDKESKELGNKMAELSKNITELGDYKKSSALISALKSIKDITEYQSLASNPFLDTNDKAMIRTQQIVGLSKVLTDLGSMVTKTSGNKKAVVLADTIKEATNAATSFYNKVFQKPQIKVATEEMQRVVLKNSILAGSLRSELTQTMVQIGHDAIIKYQ